MISKPFILLPNAKQVLKKEIFTENFDFSWCCGFILRNINLLFFQENDQIVQLILKMSAYGAAASGSFHQTLKTKCYGSDPKTHRTDMLPNRITLNNRRPYNTQGSLVAGRPSPSVSVTDSNIGGLSTLLLFKEENIPFELASQAQATSLAKLFHKFACLILRKSK